MRINIPPTQNHVESRNFLESCTKLDRVYKIKFILKNNSQRALCFTLKKNAHPPFPVLKVFFVSKIGEKNPKCGKNHF